MLSIKKKIGLFLGFFCLFSLIIFDEYSLQEQTNRDIVAAAEDAYVLPVATDINGKVFREKIMTFDIANEKAVSKTLEAKDEELSLMMLGDNLMHLGVVYAMQNQDGVFDFSPMYSNLVAHLQKADVKITNQETILGGNHLGFTGYPSFNSPVEMAKGIAKAGFNVVLHATNHATDKGLAGLQNCISTWEQHPQVLLSGIYKEKENHEIPVITVKDVTFAILNYTYSPNHNVLGLEYHGHLNLLSNYDRTTGVIDFYTLNPDVITDIKAAKEIADVVVVCPHWGNEYTHLPNSIQKGFAKQIADAGADVIIGTHPHVVQPVEWIEREDGNKTLCYYSLGNYVGTQRIGPTVLGGMAWVTFQKTDAGVVIKEEKTGIIPLVCHYTVGPTRLENVYFLDEYTEEQAKNHGIHQMGEVDLTLEMIQKWAKDVLGDWILGSKEVF